MNIKILFVLLVVMYGLVFAYTAVAQKRFILCENIFTGDTQAFVGEQCPTDWTPVGWIEY